LARGEVFSDELTFSHKDGSEREMEWIVTPLRGSKGTITHFVSVQRDISERKRVEAELKALHQQLLQTARQAGMAEVATSVLHNVGNVLTSVVTSGSVAAPKVRNSKLPFLAKTAAMLQDNADNLPQFFDSNPKAKLLPGYLTELAARLAAEQTEISSELASLSQHIDHIKQIVAMQQSYARIGGVKELLAPKDLLEDALRFNASGFERRHIQVTRDYADLPLINVEKHKVLQILVNLLSNAKNALDETSATDKKIVLRTELAENERVRLSITDNGIGISDENLQRLFQLGFTTRKEGHGFGLHNAALVAKELGGELSARSEGPGKGSTFVLEIPCLPNS
jgi:signal transduction histidine kinase